MELISEECVEGDGNRVDERPNELFSSSISKIFTTNHVQQVKKKKMKEKKRKETRTFPLSPLVGAASS